MSARSIRKCTSQLSVPLPGPSLRYKSITRLFCGFVTGYFPCRVVNFSQPQPVGINLFHFYAAETRLPSSSFFVKKELPANTIWRWRQRFIAELWALVHQAFPRLWSPPWIPIRGFSLDLHYTLTPNAEFTFSSKWVRKTVGIKSTINFSVTDKFNKIQDSEEE